MSEHIGIKMNPKIIILDTDGVIDIFTNESSNIKFDDIVYLSWNHESGNIVFKTDDQLKEQWDQYEFNHETISDNLIFDDFDKIKKQCLKFEIESIMKTLKTTDTKLDALKIKNKNLNELIKKKAKLLNQLESK